MADKMTHEDALAWKHGFEAAREADRSLTRREPVNVERSIRLAMALIETCRQQGIFLIHALKWLANAPMRPFVSAG